MHQAWRFLRTITTSSGKRITIGYVNRTNYYTRPVFPEITEADFLAAIEKNKDSFDPDTVKVIMRLVA